LERKEEKKGASYVNKKEASEAWLMPIPPVGNFSSNFILIGIFVCFTNSWESADVLTTEICVCTFVGF